MKVRKIGEGLVDTKMTPMLFLLPDGVHYVLHIKSGDEWAAAPCTLHPMAARYGGTSDYEDVRWLCAIQASLVDLLDRQVAFTEVCCVGMPVKTTRRFLRGQEAWPVDVRPWVAALSHARFEGCTISGRELYKDERRALEAYQKNYLTRDAVRECLAVDVPSRLYLLGGLLDGTD